MSDTKNYGVFRGGWLLIQCALLVVHYGFDKQLPWWVLWFPSWTSGVVLAVVLVIFLIVLLISRAETLW